jgi:hypothetical protein
MPESALVFRSSTSTARKWEALVTQADPTWRRDLRMVREFYDIRPDVVADWTTRGPYMGGVGVSLPPTACAVSGYATTTSANGNGLSRDGCACE